MLTLDDWLRAQGVAALPTPPLQRARAAVRAALARDAEGGASRGAPGEAARASTTRRAALLSLAAALPVLASWRPATVGLPTSVLMAGRDHP